MRWGKCWAALVTLAVAITACGSATSRTSSLTPSSSTLPTRSPPSSASPNQQPRVWLMTAQALQEISQYGPVSTWLGGDRILELLSAGGQKPPTSGASGVLSFRSYSDFAAALQAGPLGPSVGGVLLDLEHWSFTPQDEQMDPSHYESEFVNQARSAGLEPILAPGMDLVQARGPSGGSQADAFLSLGIAAGAARALGGASGYVELQSQSTERDPTQYASFVSSASQQVIAADPSATVLAGLSTNPPGGPVDISELAADVAATRSMVSGYWLNVPDPGSSCPGCGPADPALGASLLKMEAAKG